jgi:hypothetical protein
MKKRFFQLLVILFCSGAVFNQLQAQEAGEMQEPRKGFDKEKLFFGGNFGMSFGDYTFINITPQVGYQFNQYFAAGAGVSFIGSSFVQRDFNGNKIYKDSYYSSGLNVFGRVSPIRFLFLQLQPEINYTWGRTKFYNGQNELKLDGEFVPILLAGIGVVIPAGRGALIGMLQYNLLQNDRSIYGNRPFVSFGFNF